MYKIDDCQLCPLWKYRTNIVWAEIPKNIWNGLMLVGEAPGADEDRLAKPFAGKAGKVLDECLNLADIKRSETYITNVVKCRPLDNNIGHKDSVIALKTCPENFLSKEIGYKNIRVIVTLGGVALRYFTGENESLKFRGTKWYPPNVGSPIVFSTLHPSYILRGGARKEILIEDLKKAKELLNATTKIQTSFIKA